MSRNKPATQVTVKLDPDNEASVEFFECIENRDRELYPTIFSYLKAPICSLEPSLSCLA